MKDTLQGIGFSLSAIAIFLLCIWGLSWVFDLNKADRKTEREQLEIKFQQRQDSIQNEFTLLKQERDSLLFKYDSLSKIKKDAHIKKINSYRTLSLDSNITILSRNLSEENIAW